MDLFSLMEKNGQIQISIIRFLLNHNMKTDVSILLKELGISKFIFEKHMDELQVDLKNMDIDLNVIYDAENNTVHLKKSNDTELDRVYYYYLKQSLNYKLLTYLYEHSTFSITKLALHLSLSEAAVYRKIAKINQIIHEFDIVIKRGQIVGSELQVYFFFFMLFWNAIPFEDAEKMSNDENSLRFVAYLEKQLGQKFNESAKVKLYLWNRISKARLSVHEPDIANKQLIIETFLVDQKDDPLYKTIKEAYSLSVNHAVVSGSEYKSIYLYFFISTVFILDPSNPFFPAANYWPTFNPRVIALNELVEEKIKAAYNISLNVLNTEFIANWKYILTQVHGMLTYFKGDVTIFDEIVLTKGGLEPTIYIPDFNLVNDIVVDTERILGRSIQKPAKHLLSRIHLYFLYEMRLASHKILTIGVCYNRNYLQTYLIMQNIKAEFESKLPITCEIAKINTHYDLLISDSKNFAADYFYNELYISNDFKTSIDSNILMSLLKQLLLREGA